MSVDKIHCPEASKLDATRGGFILLVFYDVRFALLSGFCG